MAQFLPLVQQSQINEPAWRKFVSTNVINATVDIILMRRILKRDQIAVGELYDKHSSYLYTLIVRIVREQEEAEDILQEVFLRVWDRAESYNESLGTPIAWMTRIARNLSIDKLRSKSGQVRKSEDRLENHGELHSEDRLANPEYYAMHSQQQAYVGRALASLPAEQRALIECAYFQGFTQSEMAENFGIPLGTVKTRIRAGMIELRRQLKYLHVTS